MKVGAAWAVESLQMSTLPKSTNDCKSSPAFSVATAANDFVTLFPSPSSGVASSLFPAEEDMTEEEEVESDSSDCDSSMSALPKPTKESSPSCSDIRISTAADGFVTLFPSSSSDVASSFFSAEEDVSEEVEVESDSSDDDFSNSLATGGLVAILSSPPSDLAFLDLPSSDVAATSVSDVALRFSPTAAATANDTSVIIIGAVMEGASGI
mmetsp:Transcript_34965/g.71391  ORF Transcript_34965/g.71391 Transcript_34965/m.71391 type:complete len:210 (-) Transcript_34965:138-767(-)